ncbi:xylulokinase [Devosia sp.]|uniref:xylulokinase n=1 Tax=Devosia sp. TaxID=1871048 RepID=UPI003A9097BD
MQSLIGIDVGTTALKAVLIDAGGQRLASFSRPYPMARPAPGLAEQDPAEWMAAIEAALVHFEAVQGLGGLAGIGICSQVNTHVFTDAAGQALLPAITWQDSRAAPDAAALEAQVTIAQKTEWFGGPVPIDASHALSRMAHVRRVDPELYAQTRHVLLPKDYCVLQLTGEVASDAIAAVGLVNRDGYVAPLCDLVPDALGKLPPLRAFSHVVGKVRPGRPGAGAPVVVGAMDAWGGMFGVGTVAEGDAMYQCGTSEIPGIVSTTVNPTPGVILFPPYDGITMHAAPTQSGGASLAWLGRMLSQTPEALSELAAGAACSDAVPLFLPHLQGERAPLWDAETRGVFARMDSRAGAPEMARSVMEGVALSVRLAFDALQCSAGVSLASANIGGGGAQSDVWCQIRADALGIELRRASAPDPAALGAAMLAGLGSGLFVSLGAAVAGLIGFDRSFVPDASVRGYYDDRFADYQALYTALKPFNARFA